VLKARLFLLHLTGTYNYNDLMRLLNFWLLKAKEKSLLKIVDWAQRNQRKVEELTEAEIREALRSQR